MATKRTWMLATALAGLATPAVRSAAKGALVLAEVLPSPVHPLSRIRPAPKVTRIDLPTGPADLYQPRHEAPGVLLVHGANLGGIEDARVQGLATAFCQVRRTVLAPSLTLAERRLDTGDLQRIRDGINFLADRTGPVVIVAFSYGAALALAALAERPAIQGRVRAIATIGTYFDPVHLIEGITTGQVYAQGCLHPWAPPAAAMEQAGHLLAQFLSGEDTDAIVAAIDSGSPDALPSTALAAYNLIANRDPWRVRALVAELPEEVRSLLERVSPAHRIGAIRVPVLALHSQVDPAAPAIESAALIDAVRPRTHGASHLTLVGSFRHVTPAGTALGWAKDAPRLIAFAGSILRAQERWIPARRQPGAPTVLPLPS